MHRRPLTAAAVLFLVGALVRPPPSIADDVDDATARRGVETLLSKAKEDDVAALWALGKELAVFGCDPKLEGKVLGRRPVRRFKRERSLPHPAGAIQHDAPTAIFREKVLRNRLQFLRPPKERSPSWQRGMRSGGDGRRWGCGGFDQWRSGGS